MIFGVSPLGESISNSGKTIDWKRYCKCAGLYGKGGGEYLFSDDYVVSWARGHLIALYNPED